SDLLLIIDPRCIPVHQNEYAAILENVAELPGARFQVALDRSHFGTKEFVRFDGEGRVRRIQRYYDGHTWLQTQAVSSALVPVSSLFDLAAPTLEDLPNLRRALSATGALTSDVLLKGPIVDLNSESGYLKLTEYTLRRLPAAALPEGFRLAADAIFIGPGCDVASSARLYGPLVLQKNVSIGEDAVVIGPTVIGENSRIEASATIAKCILAKNTHATRGAVANQRFLAGHLEGSQLPAHFAIEDDADAYVDHWEIAAASPQQKLRESQRARYMRLKAIGEALLSLFGLLILSPLLLVVAILVRATSRGPIFFGHEREGRGGVPFKCWKFRTMVENAHSLQRELAKKDNQVDGPQFKLDNDPRVTTIGRFLRASNIDELPQLWNVIRGEMSLIGPRPSPFRENQICVPWRQARLSVRPGISGLWQICRSERQAGDFHQWIFYDILYARHISFLLDSKIFLATLLTFGGRWSVPHSWIIPKRRGVAAQAPTISWQGSAPAAESASPVVQQPSTSPEPRIAVP
ncbi:MAG: sugar transferase, partial [Phycisphaerae bacterium]